MLRGVVGCGYALKPWLKGLWQGRAVLSVPVQHGPVQRKEPPMVNFVVSEVAMLDPSWWHGGVR
jgi:hypothetical protein